MNPKVFISVGSAATPLQAETIAAIWAALERTGLAPYRMAAHEWDRKRPLAGAGAAISQCSGAVVIAFSRYHVGFGTEHRDGVQHDFSGVHLPTVWNHMEAAMAYTKGLPLLVVAEEGLRQDGVLEGGYDWVVHRCAFTPERLEQSGFAGAMLGWKASVMARHHELQFGHGAR